MMLLTLASQSPRRAKILSDLGVRFEVVKNDAPEVSLPCEPERTVTQNAVCKLEACSFTPALAADTIVWFNDKIYGKPRDEEEAKIFLRELSGNTHTVYTGVAYRDEAGVRVKCCLSDVTFRELSDADIDDYIARVHPLDRAGAYDIDVSGDRLISGWTGSYENIMGLPVEPLREWGIAK